MFHGAEVHRVSNYVGVPWGYSVINRVSKESLSILSVRENNHMIVKCLVNMDCFWSIESAYLQPIQPPFASIERLQASVIHCTSVSFVIKTRGIHLVHTSGSTFNFNG